MDYEAFRNDALENYRSLPDEKNELYKRYYMEIPLPSEGELQAGREQDSRAEAEALADLIEGKTGLKFDLVFSNSFVRNSSKSICITRMPELKGMLDKKIYKGGDNKLAAFINANSRDAIVISAKSGSTEKLNMLFINDSHLVFQCIFEAEAKSSLDVFEIFASTKTGSLSAPLHEFHVGEGAHMEFTLLNDGNGKSAFLNLSKGDLMENGKLNANFVYNGSGLTKAVNVFDTKGAGSSAEATETVYGTGNQKFDINTYMLNSKERSRTRLNTGAILDGDSQCRLKGYAKIEKYTKGAYSNINERGILLSQKAHIDALPDMSIDYSDEVSATHSAATSPIDEEALFYLTSRGIEEHSARKMFVASFLSKYLSNIRNPAAKEIASSIMLSRIEGSDFGVIKDVTPKGIWLTANTQG